MKKLITMTDFVFNMRENKDKDNIRRFWACEKYANFLKQPLELWMFVPCDGDGNVLEYPKWENEETDYEIQILVQEYQQAKERCLFDGFQMYKGNPYNYHKARAFTKDYIEEKWTIEKIIHWELQLTQTAIKQIGL